MIVSTQPELEKLVAKLREAGLFALDTEFERERTYWPRLQLIQVAVDGLEAAIDPLAVKDLSPFHELLVHPSIEKVTHAGRQDAEIFFQQMERPPARLYDTQIAAALVGMGEQVGYAALVQRVTGVKLKKTERVTDWGRRPLTEAQIDYALSDVRYLLPIREHLNGELQKLERTDWLTEELSFYEDPAHWTVDQDRIHTRVSGWRSLNRRNLAILRELALWREKTAADRDIPKNRVTGDDVLIELALRHPQQIEELRPLRRLHPREIEKSGAGILAAVSRGLEVPPEDLPTPVRSRGEDPELALVADLMAVMLRKRARENRIAPSYLGNQKALGELVGWLSGPRATPSPPMLSGWRRRLVGDDLVSLFEGKTSLRVDTGTRSVIADTEDPGTA